MQVMSAGSGIRHAEYNREPVATTLFQIWIEPEAGGGEPSWGAKPFPKSDRSGRFVPLASGFAEDDDALPIRAPARVLGATLKAGDIAEMSWARSVTVISFRRKAASKSMACVSYSRRRRHLERACAGDQSARGQRDRPRRRCVGQNEAKPPPLASRGQRRQAVAHPRANFGTHRDPRR